MTRHSKVDDIEAGIVRDRALLASTLGTLHDRLSVDNLAQEALGLVRSNAAACTRSISTAVRANPLALALTGAGLAWLIFGTRKGAKEPSAQAVSRWESEGGKVLPEDANVPDPTIERNDDTWSRDLDRLRLRASAHIHEIEQDARQMAEALRNGLTHSAATTRDFAAERAAVLTSFAMDMQKGLLTGLGDLSQAARDPIVAARERAYAAAIRAESATGHSPLKTGDLIEDHPMIAGAIALALGAVFAAALPRTRTEDRAFGSERDRLIAEATGLLRKERDRALRLAESVANDLADAAATMQDTLSEQASEAVKGRVRAEATRPEQC